MIVEFLAAFAFFAPPKVAPVVMSFHWEAQSEAVADVDVGGIPAAHVENLLVKAGVTQVRVSRLFGVTVAKSDVHRARLLLQEDAWERPYMYRWVSGVKAKLGVPPPGTWPVRHFGLTLAQIAESPIFKRDGNLRGLAKAAVAESLSGLPRSQAQSFRPAAVVDRMRLFDMQYLGDDGKLHWGYQAEVDVSVRGHPSLSWTAGLYAWDEGRLIASTPNPGRGLD